MFIATGGKRASVMMCDMDGKNTRILQMVQGLPISLSIHPSKNILFWADRNAGTISNINYLNTR